MAKWFVLALLALLVWTLPADAQPQPALYYPLAQPYTIRNYFDSGWTRDLLGVDACPPYERRAGYGDPLCYHHHTGIDIAAPPGEPVYAARGGFVVETRRDCDHESDCPVASLRWTYGSFVRMLHDDGTTTIYAHLAAEIPVYANPNRYLPAGTVIGAVGGSGLTDDVHLHFEVRDSSNAPLDPFADNLWTRRAPDALVNLHYDDILPATKADSPDSIPAKLPPDLYDDLALLLQDASTIAADRWLTAPNESLGQADRATNLVWLTGAFYRLQGQGLGVDAVAQIGERVLRFGWHGQQVSELAALADNSGVALTAWYDMLDTADKLTDLANLAHEFESLTVLGIESDVRAQIADCVRGGGWDEQIVSQITLDIPALHADSGRAVDALAREMIGGRLSVSACQSRA